jgi:hypothetical protein
LASGLTIVIVKALIRNYLVRFAFAQYLAHTLINSGE